MCVIAQIISCTHDVIDDVTRSKSISKFEIAIARSIFMVQCENKHSVSISFERWPEVENRSRFSTIYVTCVMASIYPWFHLSNKLIDSHTCPIADTHCFEVRLPLPTQKRKRKGENVFILECDYICMILYDLLNMYTYVPGIPDIPYYYKGWNLHQKYSSKLHISPRFLLTGKRLHRWNLGMDD